MSDKRYFHFTLGPVQGFVAQARRTRDFWAGSFMLSWLSAVAMQASIAQSADIKFPQADSNYLDWLTTGKGYNRPRQGSVPNRFKAEINTNFNPQLVVESVQKAWKSVADIVYKQDIEGLENPETKAIWDRQIENFWDMVWVIADEDEDSSLLDRRKNWRSHSSPAETGVKCMMMDGFQELSGTSTPHQKSLELFWKMIRNSKSQGMVSDLYDGESLCAIAFVKRRFPRYFNKLKVTDMPSNWTLYGWELKSDVPSVSYMAAVHWLKEVMIKAKTDDKVKQHLDTFDQEAYRLTHDRGGWGNEIKCIDQLIDSRKRKDSASHDGNVFFPFVLENKKLYPKQEQAKKVIHNFSELKKIAEMSEVSPFYAVLMMDGDSLGKQMSVLDNQTKISNALGRFTKQVEKTVDLHNGFLIYAGGDDVLAILPLEDALCCANALRDDYTNSFKGSGIPTTLSGAIEYVHIKTPLTKVLRDAHDLLDNIAKERTGRDALAIRIWKPGGLAVQWSQPWKIALLNPAHHQQDKPMVILQSLIEIFQNRNGDDPQFSSKFFYKIRERFDLLNPPAKKIEGETNKAILTSDQAIAFMAMEYINSSKNRNKTLQEAKEDITLLLEQCRPNYRWIDEDSKKEDIKASDYLQADGALLVRFLAHKGVE